MSPPERGYPREGEGEEEKVRGGGGENCYHQMSDFTAKMRGRAIYIHLYFTEEMVVVKTHTT